LRIITVEEHFHHPEAIARVLELAGPPPVAPDGGFGEFLRGFMPDQDSAERLGGNRLAHMDRVGIDVVGEGLEVGQEIRRGGLGLLGGRDLGAETLDAELATTEREEQTGMMFRTNIQEADAMLFVLPVPQRAAFWMNNCPESLSAAYINPEGVIAEIHHLEKEDTNNVWAATDNIKYVLEVKDGWFARHNINTGAVVRTEKGSLAETFSH